MLFNKCELIHMDQQSADLIRRCNQVTILLMYIQVEQIGSAYVRIFCISIEVNAKYITMISVIQYKNHRFSRKQCVSSCRALPKSWYEVFEFCFSFFLPCSSSPQSVLYLGSSVGGTRGSWCLKPPLELRGELPGRFSRAVLSLWELLNKSPS